MRSALHSRAASVAALVAAAGLAGCGDDDDYANDPRPPAPIVVTAAIGPERVSVSPARFGAGPITLVVTNQTRAAQRLTLVSGGSGPGIRQQTGPINPSETASLKVDVDQGTYDVGVTGGGIDAATLRVGTARPSAQNDLLQP
jgi:hypothetical protein